MLLWCDLFCAGLCCLGLCCCGLSWTCCLCSFGLFLLCLVGLRWIVLFLFCVGLCVLQSFVLWCFVLCCFVLFCVVLLCFVFDLLCTVLCCIVLSGCVAYRLGCVCLVL